MPVHADAVLAILKQLSHDIRDLDVGSSVDRHQKLPVVQFLRDYVAANKPVILTGVVSHWPAYTNWTDEYLCSLAGDTIVTVALTPNGRADAVTKLSNGGDTGVVAATGSGAVAGGGGGATARPKECFALPHQVKMPLKDFLALLRSSKQAGKLPAGGDSAAELAGQAAAASAIPHGFKAGSAVVPYLQYQNSSLTAEVPQLLGDVDLLLSWATQAFDGLPEAVNLWIGDERSVTSWHQDPFENIYAVVAGSKTFTLLPPAEVYRMRLRQYPSAQYRPAAGGARDHSDDGGGGSAAAVSSGALPLRPELDPSGETVLWSSVPPLPDAPKGPRAHGDLFSDPQLPPPLRVTVKAGEALYLPAKWWHHVEQVPDESGRAIAVNYWYDMKFDARQAYLQAIERLAQLLGLNEEPPPPPACCGSSEGGHGPGEGGREGSKEKDKEKEREGQLRPPYTSRAFG